MMGLIGQGCEHGDVLEVTGTNTPTQTHTIDVVVCRRIVCDRAHGVGNICVCWQHKRDW